MNEEGERILKQVREAERRMMFIEWRDEMKRAPEEQAIVYEQREKERRLWNEVNEYNRKQKAKQRRKALKWKRWSKRKG